MKSTKMRLDRAIQTKILQLCYDYNFKGQSTPKILRANCETSMSTRNNKMKTENYAKTNDLNIKPENENKRRRWCFKNGLFPPNCERIIIVIILPSTEIS